MKIGLLVAIEMDAIFKHYPERAELSAPAGYKVFHVNKDGNELFILQAGMGVIAAASGVQYLITKYDVDLIANFGVVGGLTNEMKKQKVCIVERVVHYKYDCSELLDLKIGQVDGHDSIFLCPPADLINKAITINPELKKVTCCSGDKFVDTPAEKMQLHNEFEGDVCDMESAGIVLTCEANNMPCILFKAVSDGLVGGAKEFFEELVEASSICLSVADKIMASL